MSDDRTVVPMMSPETRRILADARRKIDETIARHKTEVERQSRRPLKPIDRDHNHARALARLNAERRTS